MFLQYVQMIVQKKKHFEVSKKKKKKKKKKHLDLSVVREASLRNYSLSIFYVQFYFLLSVFYF